MLKLMINIFISIFMLKRKILLYLFFICIFCLIQISNTQAQDLIKLLIEKK